MSWFAKIEETCAAFIERAFANMFPSDLEPAQIARKLVATMEARTRVSEAGTIAPDRYEVYAHPNDYARLEPHKSYLQDEWAALLTDVGERAGIAFEKHPRVDLHEETEMVAGAVEIEASFAQDEVAAQPRRARRGRFMLEVVNGLSAAMAFRVSGAARVGRNPESDIHLPDPSVSRNHALLDVEDGTLLVKDAGSTNGTYLNGQRIESAVARAGDLLTFGTTEVRISAA
jgi:FHA domain-containing protein